MAWAALFGMCLVGTLGGWLIPANSWVAQILHPLGVAVPDFNVIWVVGSFPVTGVLVLLAAWSRGRWSGWWIFLGGTFLEVATKHWVATPLPHPVAEPVWLALVEKWVNPSPSRMITALKSSLGEALSGQGGALGFFRGSFFSGHVFRLTYLTGVLGGAERHRLLGLIGLAAGILVVALGGHWALDALGGFCLARMLLEADHYFRRTR